MGGPHVLQRPFDIPEIPDFVPRKLKPWLFILLVLVIQLSGGIYLSAAADMVGTTALLQEDIQMAGFAQLVGMSINFAVMFRMKFRFSLRIGLLSCFSVLIISTFICAHTDCVLILVGVCFIAGWFRMLGTFLCNSTIQLWLTPVRDMSIFFSYVYLIVDGLIQLSGLMTVYTAYNYQWEYMHWILMAIMAIMMILVLIFIRPIKGPMQIPLLGIDWIGSLLWSGVFLSFTYVCVYGNYYDWWEAKEIVFATIIGIVCLALNLWRASFLRHPYISFEVLRNKNVVRSIILYSVLFTLLGTEHVFEHTYAINILGFDETNAIDLNWYAFAGVITGVAFTYFTFALSKWRYKTMIAIGFALAAMYLAWFYFMIDYGVEKEALFVPLFLRGMSAVIISIVCLTSILQSGLSFFVFPQGLCIHGFAGAVLGSTLGPAIVGEWFSHTTAKNSAILSSAVTNTTASVNNIAEIYGQVQRQALLISMKEIYGWLLIAALIFFILICLEYSPIRPSAIFPTWKTIRRKIRTLSFR